MNPLLAQIYGNGATKTASAGDVDLSQISAADYLAALAQDDSGGIDLSNLSASELAQLAEELEAQESVESEKVAFEKMAQSGEFDHWYRAGQVLAHGFAAETEKVASGDDGLPDVIDLNNLSAEDALALLESGEYEIEKVAGARMDAAKAALSRWRARGVKANLSRYGELMSAKNVRGSVASRAGKDAGMKAKAKAYMDILRGNAGDDRATLEARKSLGAQLGTASVGGGGAAAALAAYRRKKNRR